MNNEEKIAELECRLDACIMRVESLEQRHKAFEVLMAAQQKGMELLGQGLRAHETLLTALGGLEMQRHGKHSAN